eukprot:scaffold87233_cov66-Phaeocystis_antarctica.AAC.1
MCETQQSYLILSRTGLRQPSASFSHLTTRDCTFSETVHASSKASRSPAPQPCDVRIVRMRPLQKGQQPGRACSPCGSLA